MAGRYHPDHISPPNGEYPFIEWDDLDVDEKAGAAMHSLEQMGFTKDRVAWGLITASAADPHATIGKVVAEVRDYVLMRAEEAAYEDEQRRQATMSFADLMTDQNQALKRPPSGYLDAMPRDLHRAKHLIDQGQALRTAMTTSPVPVGVMTDSDGMPIKGGSIVYGIVVERSIQVPDERTGKVAWRHKWVMFA